MKVFIRAKEGSMVLDNVKGFMYDDKYKSFVFFDDDKTPIPVHDIARIYCYDDDGRRIL